MRRLALHQRAFQVNRPHLQPKAPPPSHMSSDPLNYRCPSLTPSLATLQTLLSAIDSSWKMLRKACRGTLNTDTVHVGRVSYCLKPCTGGFSCLMSSSGRQHRQFLPDTYSRPAIEANRSLKIEEKDWNVVSATCSML